MVVSKQVTTPMKNHCRKLRLRGVCMSSMLDYHAPHLSLLARGHGEVVVGGDIVVRVCSAT
jgi:hypothetical protein